MTQIRPEPGHRIRSLDFLRGLAILGMLVANIPWHAGDSMSRVLDPDLSSIVAWLAQYLFFDQRFMPIFCMLFGAGAVLLAASHQPHSFTRFYSIRMALLFVLGVLHAYMLWPGDILITYAVCAPFVLFASGWPPARLFLVGVLLKAVDVAFAQWPEIYDASLHRLLFAWWVDYGEAPGTISEAYAGSYADLFAYNAWRNQYLQWTALPYFRVWNALGFMMIGMGLFKTGVIQGAKPARFYRRMILASLALGTPLVLYGVLARVGINPTLGPYVGFTEVLPLRYLTFSLGCAITAFAVLGSALLLHHNKTSRILHAIECVGRMALSNYLMHSLLFVLIFHSAALLPFDQLDHDVLWLLVLGTWILQITLSTIWLDRHSQGPIEWLWRRATDRLVRATDPVT